MRSIEVEFLAEAIELALLRLAGVSRWSCGLGFERAMHALMAAILLRFAGLNELREHTQAHPPSRKLRKPGQRIGRIGLLGVGAPDTPKEMRRRAAPLRELGWIEGHNLRVERRYANSLEGLKPLAEELVRAKVEVIETNGPNPTRAAMRATTTIPIVFRVASEPVLSGLVASLARPGGNVTGLSATSPEVDAKLLSLLKELLPTLQRIGMLETSGNPQFHLLRRQFEHSCRLLGLEPVFVEISAAGELGGAVERLARQRVQALVLGNDSFAEMHGFEIIGAALKRGLPTVGGAPSRAGCRCPRELLHDGG